MIRLVLCDVDGTLLDPGTGTVSARVRRAVYGAAMAGLQFGFATGRTTADLGPTLRDLGIDRAWGICSNGAVLARFAGGLPGGFENVYETTFEPAEAVGLLRQAVPGALVATWHDDVYLVNKRFPAGALPKQRVAPIGEVLDQPTSKAVLLWLKYDADQIREKTADCELPGGIAVTADKTEARFDIVSGKGSKLAAAKQLADYLRIKPAEVLAFGRDCDDAELLRWAGRGVAMGDACDEAKAAADVVTDSVEDGGAAKVLEALVSTLGPQADWGADSAQW